MRSAAAGPLSFSRTFETLAAASPDWRLAEEGPLTKARNKELRRQLDTLYRVFRVTR